MWRKTRVNDVKYDWFDCSTGFDCPCGRDIVVTDEDDPIECDCGKKYRLVTYLEVWEDKDSDISIIKEGT